MTTPSSCSRPSWSAPRQWLDQVSRAGQPVVNCRVSTIVGWAHELAALQLLAQGSTAASGVAARELVDRVVAELRAEGRLPYFGGHSAYREIVQLVHETLDLLRPGGCDPAALQPRHCDPPAKGADLQLIFQRYRTALAESHLVDQFDLLDLAVARLKQEPAALPRDAWILVPESLEPTAAEQRVLSAVPEDRVRSLACDQPSTPPAPAVVPTDLIRLRSDDAPHAQEDGSVQFAAAVEAASEVRTVLRTCRAENVPLDQVEVLHTQYDTYVPLLLETLWETAQPLALDPADLPVTFAEGIPCRYARPGRLLREWVRWCAADCPQAGLVRMWREGWLAVPAVADPPTPDRLARLLTELPIGSGRDRYLRKLDAARDELQANRTGSCRRS